MFNFGLNFHFILYLNIYKNKGYFSRKWQLGRLGILVMLLWGQYNSLHLGRLGILVMLLWEQYKYSQLGILGILFKLL